MRLRLAGPSVSEAEASPEGIVFRDDHDLVAVDFIGGDGAEGSIPCLEGDDRDHERGSEGSTHAVDAKACASLRDICLAPVLEAEDYPPHDRTPQARRLAGITGCVRLARIHPAARACPVVRPLAG